MVLERYSEEHGLKTSQTLLESGSFFPKATFPQAGGSWWVLGFVSQEIPDTCNIYFVKEDRSVVETYSVPGVGAATHPPWEPEPLCGWHMPCFPGWELDGFWKPLPWRGRANVGLSALPARALEQSWRALEPCIHWCPLDDLLLQNKGGGRER